MTTKSPHVTAVRMLGSYNQFHNKRFDDKFSALLGEITYICENWVELNEYFFNTKSGSSVPVSTEQTDLS
jgi:hypothetical protein